MEKTTAVKIAESMRSAGRLTAGAVRLERGLYRLAEAAAAALVIVEILVVSAGVFARYVIGQPLPWTDELATTLLVWLAMLGAVVATHRNEHLRLTAFVTLLPAAAKDFYLLLSSVLTFLLLVLLVHPAYEYVRDEHSVTIMTLGIPASWRSAGMLTGIALMAVMCVTQTIARSTRVRDAFLAGAGVALMGAVLLWASAALQSYGNANLILFFVVLITAYMLAGMPIAFAFGLATVLYLLFTTSAPLSVVVSRAEGGMSHIILLSVPLFVVLGLMIEMTGMARALLNFLAALVGHVRSGLNFVLLAAMYLVSGISGSKAADIAAISPILLPEMRKRGAKDGELLALLASSAAMSETIPPSLILIMVGAVTGVSIAALFTAGLLPAFILAIMLCIVARIRSRHEDMGGIRRPSVPTTLRLFVVALPALILPFIIRGAVVEGITTATEVSTIGIAYSAVVGLLIYRQFDWTRLYRIMKDAASVSGAIFVILGTANALSWAFTQSGFSQELVRAMTNLPGGAGTFMAISIIAFVVLGSVLEGLPAIVVFGPLLFPVARGLGIDEIHYAIVAVLAMGIGLFAPPFGVGYYSACAIARIDPNEGLWTIWPYLGVLLAGLAIIAAVPWLSTGFLAR